MPVDGLIYYALECFVGLGCLDHDAFEGRTVGVLAQQTESSLEALGVQTDPFDFVLVFAAARLHSIYSHWSRVRNKFEKYEGVRITL